MPPRKRSNCGDPEKISKPRCNERTTFKKSRKTAGGGGVGDQGSNKGRSLPKNNLTGKEKEKKNVVKKKKRCQEEVIRNWWMVNKGVGKIVGRKRQKQEGGWEATDC